MKRALIPPSHCIFKEKTLKVGRAIDQANQVSATLEAALDRFKGQITQKGEFLWTALEQGHPALLALGFSLEQVGHPFCSHLGRKRSSAPYLPVDRDGGKSQDPNKNQPERERREFL